MKNFNNNLVATTLVFSFVFGFAGLNAVFAAGPETVNLGAAGNFVILSKTGISTTGATSITGDIGASPIAASAITGFALTLPASSAFSTSALVTGKIYAPGYANPTPANLTTAVLDMQTAYTDAMGRSLSAITELGAGNIGGMTLAPGLYKWSTGLTIPIDVTLSGGANDIWIFQIAQNLNVSSAVKVVLAGGAQASNIFWVIAGQTTIGTTAVFNGNILDQTAIVLNTGAVLNGRALAQTAVTLDSNIVTAPVVASTPAIPAIPATSAVPTVNPAVPATPATPAISATPSANSATDAGCLPGNKFSITTGRNCNSQADANVNAPSASAFGQQVKIIASSLGKGSRGNDVATIQQFLISQNKGSAAQALANVGATAYFGDLTRAALAEFQTKAGINPPIGNFGPITRAYLSANY
jgi:hypothetical protein